MQASTYAVGYEYGCGRKAQGHRSNGAAVGIAVWPAVHADARGCRDEAETTPNNSPFLAPIRGTAAFRRASHCSGVTEVDGRLLAKPYNAQGGSARSSIQGARRRPPTDGEGTETARFGGGPSGPTSDYMAARHARRGVKFTGDDGCGSASDASDDDDVSDASSADDDDFPRGRGRRSRALELPALPGSGSASASAAALGPGASAAGAAGGPAGVTLAFLESLRAASRPGTTLRELYWSLVLPATRAARCAYVGLLGAEHRARPTHVVVCSWDERISDVVECLADHLAAITAPAAASPPQQFAAAGAASFGPGPAAPPPPPPLVQQQKQHPQAYQSQAYQSADAPAQAHRTFPGLGGGGRLLGSPHPPDSNAGRFGLRRSTEQLAESSAGVTGGGGGGGGGGGATAAAAGASAGPTASAASALAAWPSAGSAAAWSPAASAPSPNRSPSPSPGPSPGPGATTWASSGSGSGSQSIAVWLDLFAVNFHPPAAAPATAGFGAGFGAAARLAPSTRPYIPCLDDAVVERARALPSAVASIRSVLLLPGAQGAGLREHPVTLAAWHALRGRGCAAAGGAALALAAPPDVDVALVQAAFEGLAVSAAVRAPDDPSAVSGGGAVGFGAETSPGGAAGSQPPSIYASPDRLAVRAAREGAAGGGATAAAAAAIYAADPLPSRTVREGLAAAATAAANALLGRPVSLSAARPTALLQIAMSLPPAPTPAAPPSLAPSSPLLQPSTPQPLSPTLQPHGSLQGRSFSVNALEAPSSNGHSSRLSVLSSPLRSGSAAAAAAAGSVPSARSLLPAGEPWSLAAPAVAAPPPSVASCTVGSFSGAAAASAAAAAAVSLLRAPSGRSVSFTSLPSGASPMPRNDDDDDEDELKCGGAGGGAEPRVGHLAGGGGGGGRDRRPRLGSSLMGMVGAGEVRRGSGGGGWPASSTAAAVTASHDGAVGGDMQTSARRLWSLIPPLDVSMPSALSPLSSLQPGLSPSFSDHHMAGSSSSGRLLKLRSGAVAPWEASTPLPTMPSRSPSGPAASGGSGGAFQGGLGITGPSASPSPGGGDDAEEAAPPPPPPLLAPILSALGPRGLALDAPALLPRLAPLQLHGGAAAAAALPPAPPRAATAVGSSAADATSPSAITSSAPLPLPFREVESAAAAEAAAGSLMSTPFGQIRQGIVIRGPQARGRGAREAGGAAEAAEVVGRASDGTDPDPDPDPDLLSDAAQQDSDMDSDVPAIVLESLNSFLTGQDTHSTLESFANGHAASSGGQQLSYNVSGGGGGGAAQSVVGSDGSGTSTSTAPAAAEVRSLPAAPAAAPAPEPSPPYDLPPYRPLAPDLSRLVGMGRLMAALGQPLAAFRLVRHALTSARSFHGSNHPDTARCASALGWLALLCQQQQQQQVQPQQQGQQQQQQPPSRQRSGSEADLGGGGAAAAAAAATTRPRFPSGIASPGDRYAGPSAFVAAPPAGLAFASVSLGRGDAGSGGGSLPPAAGLPGAASAPVGGVLSGSFGPPPLLRSAASPSRTRLGHGGGGALSAAPSSPGLVAGPVTLEEAEGLLRGAASVLERFLGPDSEETLAARQGLAAVLAAQGRYDEAIPVLQRAATGRASRRRPPSEGAVGSAIDLATCLAAVGRAKEARKLLRAQLVRLQEDEDEAEATAAAAAMAAARGGRGAVGGGAGASPAASVGHTLSSGGSASVPAPSPALSGGRMPYGGGGAAAAVSGSCSFVGSSYGSPVGGGACGGGSGGGAMLVAAMTAAAAAAGGQAPYSTGQQQQVAPRGLTSLKREELRAKCAHQLAQLKAACGKAQAARILYRRAVQSYAAVYGNSHAVTACCMLSLAALNHTVREYGEALELYRAVLDLYVEMYGPYHPTTTRVSNRLGQLEEEMEEAEMEAEEAAAAASGGGGGSGGGGQGLASSLARRGVQRQWRRDDSDDGADAGAGATVEAMEEENEEEAGPSGRLGSSSAGAGGWRGARLESLAANGRGRG